MGRSAHLGYPDTDGEKVDEKMAVLDVVPGDCPPVHDELAPGVVPANEANMEADKQLNSEDETCGSNPRK